MENKINPTKITRLWKKMGSMAALADRLKVSENTVRRWENGKIDINNSGYRFELDRLFFEYRIQ